MKSNLSAATIAETFRTALEKGLIREEDTLAIFYDLDLLEQRVRHLQACFPGNALHAIAMKANPLEKILLKLKDFGVGAEVASFGELRMAENAGYPAARIVYDSPVKTIPELEYAIRTGVHINIDSLAELERIAAIRKRIKPAGTFGIRINPQIGTGAIAESSVAGEYSKFGVPVKFRRKELLKAFADHEWLTGVHLHVGSQGCPMEMLIDGIGVLYDFVREVNQKIGFRQISLFDIGGGMPVSYQRDLEPLSMQTYADAIRTHFPELFTSAFTLLTEFGRWVHVNPGWTVSRVEYLKNDGGIRTAMIHAGADLFLRECLNPKDWHHEYSVLDQKGKVKSGTLYPHHLAGPLCFSGDILAKDVRLPEIEEGDYLVIHDSGGYTFGMWSRYNSRFTPKMIGYQGNHFEILKERENVEDLLGFWK